MVIQRLVPSWRQYLQTNEGKTEHSLHGFLIARSNLYLL
jgi:hypothetical protein